MISRDSLSQSFILLVKNVHNVVHIDVSSGASTSTIDNDLWSSLSSQFSQEASQDNKDVSVWCSDNYCRRSHIRDMERVQRVSFLMVSLKMHSSWLSYCLGTWIWVVLHAITTMGCNQSSSTIETVVMVFTPFLQEEFPKLIFETAVAQKFFATLPDLLVWSSDDIRLVACSTQLPLAVFDRIYHIFVQTNMYFIISLSRTDQQ